jgi:DNA-binding IclR family transcriptional regulator
MFPPMAADDNSVLGRAALILDAFDGSAPELALGDLIARSGLPKSTVHRLAHQLVDLGWLERRTGGYRVGLRLFEVGGLADRRKRLVERSGPHLQELSATTGWAVHLGVLDATDVIYLLKLPIKGLDVPTRDGGRMPAHCTGLGKAMLAWSPGEQIDRVVAGGLERRTPTTIVDPIAFRAELAAIRDRGVAYDRDEACPGLSCVAAPIRGSGRAVGAVSVTGFSGRFDFRSVEAKVRVAATGIWRDLFGSPRSDVA